MSNTIKIKGYDYSLIRDCITSWNFDGCDKIMQYHYNKAQKESELIKIKYREIKDLKNNRKNFSDDEYRQEIDKKWNEVQMLEENADSLNSLVCFYKKLVDDISLQDEDGILIVGKQENVVRKKDEYSLYSYYQGDRFGNLVGSINKKYTKDEFKGKYNQIFRLDDTNIDDELSEKILKKQVKSDLGGGKSVINVSIEIHSRFDRPRGYDIENKPFFLLTLLTKGKLKLNNYKVPENTEDSVFDMLLLFQLREHLLEASKKGVYQTYQTFEENGTRIRGAIDFAKHIKLNLGLNNGKVAYRYREKTANNYLNHLIMSAYEYLKEKYPEMVVDNLDSNIDIFRVISLLKNETGYPQYDKRRLISKNLSPITHPYYTEYEQLRKTCLSILRNEGLSLFGGIGKDVSGILYYIPDLWEQYLENILSTTGFVPQKTIKIIDRKFSSRPDFVFEENDRPYMILDAKFKQVWEGIHFKEDEIALNKGTTKFENVSSDFDKCIRDMRSITSNATGVIFPVRIDDIVEYNEGGNKMACYPRICETAEDNKQDAFYTFPIIVNEPSNNYNEWRNEFDSFVTEEIKYVKAVLLNEKNYFFTSRNIDDYERELLNTKDSDQLVRISRNLKELLVVKKDCINNRENLVEYLQNYSVEM